MFTLRPCFGEGVEVRAYHGSTGLLSEHSRRCLSEAGNIFGLSELQAGAKSCSDCSGAYLPRNVIEWTRAHVHAWLDFNGVPADVTDALYKAGVDGSRVEELYWMARRGEPDVWREVGVYTSPEDWARIQPVLVVLDDLEQRSWWIPQLRLSGGCREPVVLTCAQRRRHYLRSCVARGLR